MSSNAARVVVVTGASRGAGKGIAEALGSKGDTVYVTGRSSAEGGPLPGTVYATAAAVTASGGSGIPVICDHADDAQVQALFERVQRDHGRLDILVNNAIALPDGITDDKPFWEKPLSQTTLFEVGMRSHLVATYFAARLLIESGGALVVNTSSFGGRIYMHGPAYGAGKAATDKMAHDMAVDFQPFGVSVIALWMGLMLTERTQRVLDAEPEKYAALLETIETPQFPGLVIDALARDPKRAEKSGGVHIAAELAQEYGVLDSNGKQPPSHRAFFGDPTVFGDAIVK